MCGIGAAMAGLCVVLVGGGEATDADNAFRVAFGPQTGQLHTFFQLQLLALRGVCDALSVLPSDLSAAGMSKVRAAQNRLQQVVVCIRILFACTFLRFSGRLQLQ